MNTTIRLADINDLEGLCHLFARYLTFYKKEVHPERVHAFLKERMEKKESVIFIASEGTNLLGFTQMYPTFSSLSQKHSWILNDLFVAPEGRRQGIAEKLLKTSEDFSLKSGSAGLSLMTAKTNATAQALYEKLGWKKDSDFLTYTLNH